MRGRLLPLTAGSASWNMAIDQAVLESVEKTSVPTLRLYGWIEPTLSLGYFQQYQSRESHVASRQAVCVRRSTGGGAILHHHDLTYCLVWPMAASATRQRQQLYRQAHDSITAMLRRMIGVRASAYRLEPSGSVNESAFLCFQRRTDEDLIVSGYKVLGSAQRRTRKAVLQHGSLLLRATAFAPELPGLFDLTSKSIDPIEMVDPIAEASAAAFGCDWQVGELTDQERSRGQRIASEKFAAAAWTHRR